MNIGIKNCGTQLTDEDFKALSQEERKRLGQLVRQYRETDKITPEKELLARAWHVVTAASIPFD